MMGQPEDIVEKAAHWLASLEHPPFVAAPLLEEKFGLNAAQSYAAIQDSIVIRRGRQHADALKKHTVANLPPEIKIGK